MMTGTKGHFTTLDENIAIIDTLRNEAIEYNGEGPIGYKPGWNDARVAEIAGPDVVVSAVAKQRTKRFGLDLKKISGKPGSLKSRMKALEERVLRLEIHSEPRYQQAAE
jgi:hypothetical protein